VVVVLRRGRGGGRDRDGRRPDAERPRLAINAFGYAYGPILLRVVAIAAALKHATGHPFDTLDLEWALALGGGASVFLLGEALFRRTLGLPADGVRALAGLLALATIPIGTQVAASAQVLTLIALFTAMLLAARRTRPVTAPAA